MGEAKKIFIVEDDLVLLETLQEILEMHGYQCQGCHEPEKAVKLIENYRPDLIIMDYLLPDWNGGELCAAVRSVKGFENIPVIITSAYTKIVYSLSEYGCNAVLEKPFSIHEMISLVNKLLFKKNSRNSLFPKIKFP